eukprot:6695226-Heterocapsa_arctica.AAC.1
MPFCLRGDCLLLEALRLSLRGIFIAAWSCGMIGRLCGAVGSHGEKVGDTFTSGSVRSSTASPCSGPPVCLARPSSVGLSVGWLSRFGWLRLGLRLWSCWLAVS